MSWWYDEMRQVGLDFEDTEQVTGYDSRQGSNRGAERELVERLGISAGQFVLDLGCGTGSFARQAAQLGARVRAVDVSESMLEFVRSSAARAGISNLEVEHAGFLTFDAPKKSIDVIVSRFALHHLPDFWKQVALLRLFDVLRPTGLLYLRDVVFSFEAGTYEQSVEDWVRRMPEISGFSREDFETHMREEYSTFAWIIEGFLQRAGFEVVEKAYHSNEYAEYLCRPGKAAG